MKILIPFSVAIETEIKEPESHNTYVVKPNVPWMRCQTKEEAELLQEACMDFWAELKERGVEQEGLG
jgi:hypothetical protein